MSNIEEPSAPPTDEQNEPPRSRLRSNSFDKAVNTDQTNVTNSPVKTPSPEPEKNPSQNDNIYIIKWIDFNYERLPILLQNVNGPCPLLAIANILLLRKRIHINPNIGAISTERIISGLADFLLQIDQTKSSDEAKANYERNVEDALAVLPKLTTGIDVNLRFHGVDQFEYTRECSIFDLLSIQLFHGWVIDPQNNELKKIVNSNASSYNQLIEKMIRQKQSKEENLVRESLLIEQFLEENRSQLTHYGILQLNETMRDNQLAVLFRNNHFSTIWKNNNQLLLLVSDQGYLDHPSIVFETLTDIDNDSSFTDGYGRTWRKPAPPMADSSRDRELAVAIHNEERRQYHDAQLQQQRRQQQPERYPHEEQSSRKSKKKHRHRSDEYYDDVGGCILS